MCWCVHALVCVCIDPSLFFWCHRRAASAGSILSVHDFLFVAYVCRRAGVSVCLSACLPVYLSSPVSAGWHLDGGTVCQSGGRASAKVPSAGYHDPLEGHLRTFALLEIPFVGEETARCDLCSNARRLNKASSCATKT